MKRMGIISLVWVFIDQVIKFTVVNNIKLYSHVKVIPNFF